MKAFRKIGAIAIALGLTAALAGPAAASTVSITGTSRTGDLLTVDGSATFPSQPHLTLGTDPAGDAPPIVAQLGGDLVAFSMATLTNGNVQFRWTVDELPPVVNGSPTGIVYGFTFCVEETNCFAVTSQRVIAFPVQANGGHDFWRCADPSCSPGDWSYVSTGAATYAADGTITVTLTAGQIGASAGARISAVSVSDQGPAFVGTGESLAVVLVSPALDGVAEVADYTVARREVSLAVGPAGLDPASVAYTTLLNPTGNGPFSSSVNVAGLEGEHAVYARACFGPNNCGYATQTVEL